MIRRRHVFVRPWSHRQRFTCLSIPYLAPSTWPWIHNSSSRRWGNGMQTAGNGNHGIAAAGVAVPVVSSSSVVVICWAGRDTDGGCAVLFSTSVCSFPVENVVVLAIGPIRQNAFCTQRCTIPLGTNAKNLGIGRQACDVKLKRQLEKKLMFIIRFQGD